MSLLTPLVSVSTLAFVEWCAVGTALISVLGNIALSRWAWLVQIASSVLYLAVFSQKQLYGLAILQIFFIATAARAYSTWHASTPDNHAKVRRLTFKQGALLVAMIAVVTIAAAQGLAQITGSSEVSIADAALTVGSIAAQWLMSVYFLEAWIIWACVNAMSVVLFSHVGLWPSAGLYSLFFVLAVVGYRQWQSSKPLL